MRHITKGKEPESLTQYRATASATYEGYADKDGLRGCLLRDQGYVCCYCMQRISADKMRIEHWEPQSPPPGVTRTSAEQREVELSYRNLLGACRGGERTKEERLEESARPKRFHDATRRAPQAKKPPHAYHHCDKLKGDTPITVNPADPSKRCDSYITYLPDGEITSDDEMIRKDLDETLNLNLGQLKKNRKAVIDNTVKYLRTKYPAGDWTASILQHEIQRRTTPRLRFVETGPHGKPGQAMMLDEYCQVAIYYLRKKLKRVK